MQNTLAISASDSETSQVWSFVHSERAGLLLHKYAVCRPQLSVDGLHEEVLLIYVYFVVLYCM